MTQSILLFGGLLPPEVALLSKHFNVLRFSHDRDPEAVIRENRDDIVGVISVPSLGVSRSLIEALPNLEIISQFGVGIDNIDLAAAKERNIAVTNTPELVTNDTADIALALLLGVARRTMEADLFVRIGKWKNGSLGMSTSLTGKKAGILGLGRIGKAIAQRAAAFEMDILYHSRSEKEGVEYEYVPSVKELAEKSDFLICACPGTAETENIVNADILEALGSDGFLINIARGSVVDEDALLVALTNQQIAGAGLDVFKNEPHVPEALFKMDNVVLFPHIGTATIETRSQMGQLVLGNLLAHFKGEPLLTPVELLTE